MRNGNGNGKRLDGLIASVLKARLVDTVQKRGRGVYISAGGEGFTLGNERAEEFLTTLLQIGRPLPTQPGRPSTNGTK